jgi:restriction endonuclease BglII
MRIAARYSFNKGEQEISKRYPSLISEIESVITSIDARHYRTKRSREKTKKYRMLFSPKELNKAFKREFLKRGWQPKKERCEYSKAYYVEGYEPPKLRHGTPYREMDFVKEKLGVEVQLGKYSFMVYNVCAKMTIFKNLGHIDCGVEIVPMHGFAKGMSTGVSYFEQFAWDLTTRGVANIDVPVLILGVDVDVVIKPSEEMPIGSDQPGEILQQL